MLWCDEKVDPPQPSLDTLLISRPMSEPEELDLFGDPEMMALFIELHNGNPREGPGDDESTLRALAAIPELPERPDILDVGCGPGMQTLALAEATGGNITAFDYFPQFLDQLKTSAAERGIHGRINTVQGDMNNLPFEPGSFDLIWSEGAIYIMGFENGLREWMKYLKPGGAIAVSQITWLKDDVKKKRPNLYDWWMEHCPDIRTIGENLNIVTLLGYEVLGHFTLPESTWWDGYFASLTKGFERMREAHPNNEKVKILIDMELEEQQIYRDNSDWYGYEFYVMRSRI